MADDDVRAGLDHLLPRIDLHHPGRITVLPDCQEEYEIPEENHSVGREDYGNRQIRPSEPVIEARDDKADDENDRRERYDCPLLALPLPPAGQRSPPS